MPTIHDLSTHLEKIAPLSYQESYDNCGLITGNSSTEVKGITVCLDSTEEVILDAIKNNCNVVVAHHPIVFSGLKKLNGKNYVERAILTAIRNDVSIYAIHTNLDNVSNGVNWKIGEILGLQNLKILSPKKNLLRKLVTFCPVDKAGELRNALFAAGAGMIGNYDECSFNVAGEGTFRGNETSDPYVGKKGQRHSENEIRIEVILEGWKQTKVLKALIETHPYEEVAYDIYPLENSFQNMGSGMVGELPEGQSERTFLETVKKVMKAGCIRHTAPIGQKVKKVAICGGSGSFLLNEAIQAGAQAFVTADFKYHQFFDADNRILIADIGHYESEQFTMELIKSLILEKFSTFAVRLTEVITNPIQYL